MNEVNPSILNQTEKYKIQKQSSFNEHVGKSTYYNNLSRISQHRQKFIDIQKLNLINFF